MSEKVEFAIKKNHYEKFKGLFALAFTCFRHDENMSLDTSHIDKYAAFLKIEKTKGVIINGIVGEGPSMNVRERKRNTEVWFDVARKYDLILIVQIGGAPIADVIELAKHAEKLRVDAVMLLPDPLYKPKDMERLLSYCKIVSSHCITRPFIYLHCWHLTDVNLNLDDLFKSFLKAKIPNFLGIQYANDDMSAAVKCIENDVPVFLAYEILLAAGFAMGFEQAAVAVMSIKPDICNDIYNAIRSNDLPLARAKQRYLNAMIFGRVHDWSAFNFVNDMKTWFNDEMLHVRKLGFSAGPTRRMI